MNIETAAVILFLLAVLGLAILYANCAQKLKALERDLEYERGFRRDLQSSVYEMRGELRGGFQQLGLRWKGKEDARWVAGGDEV